MVVRAPSPTKSLFNAAIATLGYIASLLCWGAIEALLMASKLAIHVYRLLTA